MSSEVKGRPLAVVALSGGMDSCVTAAIAHSTHDLALLHVTYGQRTASRERQAFEDIADFYGVPEPRRMTADLDHLRRIGGSSLTDPALAVPDFDDAGPGIPNTYVPFRNANILSVAVSWAEVLGAVSVFFGAVEQDSSGYPDCRVAFVKAFQHLVNVGTRAETAIRVEAPLIDLKKAEIVRRGVALGAPLHLTWSCYQNADRACGRCDSCRLRLRAFRAAGLPDPIPYD